MQAFYALAAKKATLEAELSTESLLLDEQYEDLCRRLGERRSRLEETLGATDTDWVEKFRACTDDGVDEGQDFNTLLRRVQVCNRWT